MAPLLALLLIFLAAAPHHTHAFFKSESKNVTCTLHFHLDPDGSQFALSGAVEKPYSAVLAPPDSRIGVTGIFQVLYEAKDVCPNSAKDVFEAVQASSGAGVLEIVTPALIEVYPGVLSAVYDVRYEALRIGGLRFGVEGEVEVNGVGTGLPDMKYFEVNASVTSVTDRAWVGESEPGIEIIIEGNTGVAQSVLEGYVSIENDTLSLGFLEMEIKAGVAGPLLVSTNGTVVSGIVQLKGNIVSKAMIGCKPECGGNGHGKCGKKESGDFTCICECGWTGANCEIPKGFCPTYSDLLEDVSGSCEGRQQLDPSTRECTKCVEGWKGSKCNSCANDQVCNTFWNDDNMQCIKAPEFLSQTQYKVFSCDFKGSTYQSFVGDSIEFGCNTTGLATGAEPTKTGKLEDGIGPGPWCELSLTWTAKTPVRCIATQCDVSVNSSRGFCAKGICECEGGPCTGDALKIFGNGVSDIELNCKKGEGDFSSCDLSFGSLAGLKLSAPCFVSECLDPDAEAFIGDRFSRKKDGTFRWELILLGVPLYLAVILGACLGCPAWVFHRKVSRTPGEYVYGGSTRHIDVSQETSEIMLESVTCSVPKRKTAEEKQEEGSVLRKLSTFSTNTTDGDSDIPKNPLPQLKGLTHEVIEMLQPPRNGFKTVLQNVSCTFTTGEMVAIMGPSGCGKSTFLSVLSGMSLFGASQRIVTGRILVNGKKRGSWIKKIAVFVPQEDHIMAMLTVRECLTYSAILRLPVTTSMDTVFKRVFSSLTELGLERVADSQVGGVRGVRGISGGEKRRVTIGMEMVTRPKIILMDEPTSGLDSHTALSLITMLKDISQHGRLVMFSVHQPSPVMFNKLDKILLLAHGFPIYLGPPHDIDGFFKRYGRPVPRGTHCAEHMLAVVSRPRTLVPLLNSIFAPKNRVDEEVGQGIGQGVRRAMHSVIMDGELSLIVPPEVQDLGWFGKIMQRIRRSILHLQVNFWRGFVDISRNPVLLLAHWVMAIVMGVGLGFIFFDVKKDFAGAQNRLGGFFFCLAFLAFTSSTTVEVLHAERTVVLREVKSGYYSPFPYLLSKIILDALLLRAIPALLLGVPYYMLSGLDTDASKFFIFLFTACTFNMTVGAISMTLAILIMNSGAASLVINIVILVSLLFANFPANAGTIPAPLSWINHISFIGYGLRIMAVNEIDGSVFQIKADENLPAVTVNSDTILGILGFSPERFTRDTIAIVGMCFAAILMVVVSLWLRAKFGEIQKFKNKVMWLRHKKAIMKKKDKIQRHLSTNSTLEMFPNTYDDAPQTLRSQTNMTRPNGSYV